MDRETLNPRRSAMGTEESACRRPSNACAPAPAKLAFARGSAVALIAAALLSGCGNWSDEDAEFLASAPKKEDLTLSSLSTATSSTRATAELAPGLGQRQDALLGRSSIYDSVSAGVAAVNGLVAWLTTGLDAVRSLPPSVRESGKRVWGPYPDKGHPGLEVQIAMRREDDGYRYELQWRQQGAAEFVTAILGHFRGERAKGGSGDLTLDFDKAREVGIASALEPNKTLELRYDLTRQTPNELIATKSTGAKERWKYIVDPDGGGDVQFQVDANFYGPPGSADESVVIHARWRADRAGRSSVVLGGGDLPSGGLFHSGECWAADQSTVYSSKDFGCPLLQSTCSEGDEGSCAVPAFE